MVESGGDLESLKKNSLLTLDANVFGPLDEASEVPLGLDVATDSKVTRILLEQSALVLAGTTLGATAGDNLLANFLSLNTQDRSDKHSQRGWQRDASHDNHSQR